MENKQICNCGLIKPSFFMELITYVCRNPGAGLVTEIPDY